MPNVVAVIVSHDPDLARFRLVLNSLVGEVDGVIIVDNASRNINEIMKLCGQVPNCSVVRLQFNSGIAYALMKGVHYAMDNYNPEWLLFLDDDTILINNALHTVFKAYTSLPEKIRDRVGVLHLGATEGDCKLYESRYNGFSGTLIKSNIAIKVCCRSNFFLDQADIDLYIRVRELGYLALNLNCKLTRHKLGVKAWVPVISNIVKRYVSYEPPWRYYYIVRNSTILLKEGRLDSLFYVRQLLDWGGIRILLRDGPLKFLKPLGLGLLHGIMNYEGVIEPRIFNT